MKSNSFVRAGLIIFREALAWIPAIYLVLFLRFDFHFAAVFSWNATQIALLAFLVSICIGIITRILFSGYSDGRFFELKVIVSQVLFESLLLTLTLSANIDFLSIPRTIPLLALPLVLVYRIAIQRLLKKLYEKSRKPKTAKNVLIFGAGYIGRKISKIMLTNPNSLLLPIGFLDDDSGTLGKRINGLRVLGNRFTAAKYVKDLQVDTILVAISETPIELVDSLLTELELTDVKIKVLPQLSNLFDAGSIERQINEIVADDLLGKDDTEEIESSDFSYLANKTIMITGAGGSIGSELARQLSKISVSKLVLLDRDEASLQDLQISLYGHGLLTGNELVLADVRDEYGLLAIFQEMKPDIVFHAAALKHLTLLEKYPREAWKTNVLGTLNTLRAASSCGTKIFVNISTDKAADPSSILGSAKLITEKLTSWFAAKQNDTYISVRFGNVLGSRGSLVPILQKQILKGGPVTITHPDMTRYFMSIREACSLVIISGSMALDGVFVLDMGEPMSILKIAKRLITLTGSDVPIEFTGIRPGEKIHEELFSLYEIPIKTANSKISRVEVEPLDPESLLEMENRFLG